MILAYSDSKQSEKLEDLKIKVTNLKKFFECILKLGLNSSSEIILDIPVDKLADASALKCMEYCGITDRKTGLMNINDVCLFIESANTMNIIGSKKEA